MALMARRISLAHKILGLIVGLPLLFWTLSGLFFTLFPIEQIRGEHLPKAPDYAAISATADVYLPPHMVLGDKAASVTRMTLRPSVTGPVYEVRTEDETYLFDAVTGVARSPIDEATARLVAMAHWAGSGELQSVTLVNEPPREAGSDSPLWRAKFQGSDTAVFWIRPDTGELKAVRTLKWRIFDVLWRFHIMDITGADRFDSWWLRAFAALAVSLVILGFVLLFHRAGKRRLLK